MNVATILCFFVKEFTTSKASLILTCSAINFKLLITGCSQAWYVSRGTFLECLPSLEKSIASLGKGWEALDDQWSGMVS